jgi:hypothetical protein
MRADLVRSEKGRQLLEALARERGLDPEVLLDLVDAVEEHSGMMRRRGMFLKFDSILDRPRD